MVRRVFLATFFLLFVALNATAEQTATLVSMRGKVKVQTPDLPVWSDTKEGAILPEGSKVLTGPNSSCSIAIGEEKPNKLLKMESSTELSLQSFERGELYMQTGKLFTLVTGLKKGQTFSVKSPTAVASARGTAWVQEVLSDKADRVTVHASKVLVRAYERTAIMRPNEVADISDGVIRSSPVSEASRAEWNGFLKDMEEYVKQTPTQKVYVVNIVSGQKKVTVLPEGEKDGKLLGKDQEYSKGSKFCLPADTQVTFQDDRGNQKKINGPGVGRYDEITAQGELREAYMTAIVIVQEGAVVVDDGKTQSLIKGNTESGEGPGRAVTDASGTTTGGKSSNVVVQDPCGYKIFDNVPVKDLFIDTESIVENVRTMGDPNPETHHDDAGADMSDTGAGDQMDNSDISNDTGSTDNGGATDATDAIDDSGTKDNTDDDGVDGTPPDE